MICFPGKGHKYSQLGWQSQPHTGRLYQALLFPIPPMNPPAQSQEEALAAIRAAAVTRPGCPISSKHLQWLSACCSCPDTQQAESLANHAAAKTMLPAWQSGAAKALIQRWPHWRRSQSSPPAPLWSQTFTGTHLSELYCDLVPSSSWLMQPSRETVLRRPRRKPGYSKESWQGQSQGQTARGSCLSERKGTSFVITWIC